jgi:hypothetical protein
MRVSGLLVVPSFLSMGGVSFLQSGGPVKDDGDGCGGVARDRLQNEETPAVTSHGVTLVR